MARLASYGISEGSGFCHFRLDRINNPKATKGAGFRRRRATSADEATPVRDVIR